MTTSKLKRCTASTALVLALFFILLLYAATIPLISIWSLHPQGWLYGNTSISSHNLFFTLLVVLITAGRSVGQWAILKAYRFGKWQAPLLMMLILPAATATFILSFPLHSVGLAISSYFLYGMCYAFLDLIMVFIEGYADKRHLFLASCFSTLANLVALFIGYQLCGMYNHLGWAIFVTLFAMVMTSALLVLFIAALAIPKRQQRQSATQQHGSFSTELGSFCYFGAYSLFYWFIALLAVREFSSGLQSVANLYYFLLMAEAVAAIVCIVGARFNCNRLISAIGSATFVAGLFAVAISPSASWMCISLIIATAGHAFLKFTRPLTTNKGVLLPNLTTLAIIALGGAVSIVSSKAPFILAAVLALATMVLSWFNLFPQKEKDSSFSTTSRGSKGI